MIHTPELRAAIHTLKIVMVSLMSAGALILSINILGIPVTGIIFCSLMLVYLIRMVYLIERDTQAGLDKLNSIK